MLEARVLRGLREPLLTRNGAGEGLSQGPWHRIFTAVGLRQPEGRLTRGPLWSGRPARSGRWGRAAGGGPAWGGVSRGMSSKLLSPGCRAGECGWGWDGRVRALRAAGRRGLRATEGAGRCCLCVLPQARMEGEGEEQAPEGLRLPRCPCCLPSPDTWLSSLPPPPPPLPSLLVPRAPPLPRL